MKRNMNMSVIAVLLTVFTAAVVLTGCPNVADGGGKKGGGTSLTGTVWEVRGHTLKFTGADSGEYITPGGNGTFTYTANKITFTSGLLTGTFDYTVSGSTLTVKNFFYGSIDLPFSKTADGGKKGGGTSLKGTEWSIAGFTLKFTGADSGEYSNSIPGQNGTFTYTADKITFTSGSFDGTFDYTVSGNTLTVKGILYGNDLGFIKQ